MEKLRCKPKRDEPDFEMIRDLRNLGFLRCPSSGMPLPNVAANSRQVNEAWWAMYYDSVEAMEPFAGPEDRERANQSMVTFTALLEEQQAIEEIVNNPELANSSELAHALGMGMGAAVASSSSSVPAAITSGDKTADGVLDLLSRHCVKGDTFCQEYSLLCVGGMLDHGKPCALGSGVAEGEPTERDRVRVSRLRKKEVEWMEQQPDGWRQNEADQGQPPIDPKRFLPPKGYLAGGMTELDESKYGNLTTLTAASAVLEVDCVALDETALEQSNLAFFSGGRQSVKSANEIYERIKHSTGVPVFVISFNGERGAGGAPSRGGHYAAGKYQGEHGRSIWTPPPWLTGEAEVTAPAEENAEAAADGLCDWDASVAAGAGAEASDCTEREPLDPNLPLVSCAVLRG